MNTKMNVSGATFTEDLRPGMQYVSTLPLTLSAFIATDDMTRAVRSVSMCGN